MMLDNILFRTNKSSKLKPLDQAPTETISVFEFEKLKIENKCNSDLICATAKYVVNKNTEEYNKALEQIEQERRTAIFDLEQKNVKYFH